MEALDVCIHVSPIRGDGTNMIIDIGKKKKTGRRVCLPNASISYARVGVVHNTITIL